MNKPGSDVEDLKGGVAGGSILKGNLTYNVNLFALPQINFNQIIRHYVINTVIHKLFYRSAQSWTRNRS